MTTTRTWPLAALAALAFALGYAVLRTYWAAGGRWGYSACEAAGTYPPAELTTGCPADQLATLPFWSGWGAVALCVALAVGAVSTLLRRGWLPAAATWLACATLVTLSFPGHLLFEIPVALTGELADWRTLLHRLVLLGGGLLFGAAAASTTPRGCAHPRTRDVRPAPRWVRWWTYAGCALPVLGFTVPHTLWVLGVPLGIGRATLVDIAADLDLGTMVALCAAPALGGLLTIGLGMRWGQVLPRWVPLLGQRRVPRLLALVPAAVTALSLVVYGALGLTLMGQALAAGTATWDQFRTGWAVAGTELVFLLWGVSLSVATAGYYLLTRPRCDRCRSASPARALWSPRRAAGHRAAP